MNHNENSNESITSPSAASATPACSPRSLGFRVGEALGVTLLLGLAVLLVYGLIAERYSRAREVERTLRDQWGGAQIIRGPFVLVPLLPTVPVPGEGTRRRAPDQPADVSRERRWWVIPADSLTGVVRAELELRHRGPFRVPVYRANASLSGTFSFKTATSLPPPRGYRLDWEGALVFVGLSEVQSIDRRVTLLRNGAEVGEFQPAKGFGVDAPGLAMPLSVGEQSDRLEWSLALPFRGSGTLGFAAGARQSEVKLTANWPHPNFVGQLLPVTRTITSSEFEAHWISSPYASQGAGGFVATEADLSAPAGAGGTGEFGVRLEDVVGPHRQSERAIKYAFLFVVGLVIYAFCLDLPRRGRSGFLRWLGLGLSGALFYLLCLSLSELWGFETAYGVSGGILLVMIYAVSGPFGYDGPQRRALLGGCVGLFGFQYFLLCLEDYALLAGTLAVALSLVVVFRRLGRELNETRRFPIAPEASGAPR